MSLGYVYRLVAVFASLLSRLKSIICSFEDITENANTP